MRIGAHLSVAGGITKAMESMVSMGGNCLQIFSSPPQQWKSSTVSAAICAEFKQEAKTKDVLPVFVHGTYLINLASDNEYSVQQSKQSLINDLQFCERTGATGVIFHFGSHPDGWNGKKQQLIPVIHEILSQTPEETFFIIENSAGTGKKIGSTLEELSTMVNDCNNPRVKICLDTAHAFAAGYDLRTPETVDRFVDLVNQRLGWNTVLAIHLNDSKVDFDKKNDRHENIGEGFIGKEGLAAFINHSQVKNLPFILEVPGFEGNGPDQKNIEIVRSLVI